MALRPMASATVTFGLVTVPVRVYSAAERKEDLSFHLLHAPCGTRVKQQYVCPKEDVVITRDQMVKGYEFAKDQHVTFTEAELKALAEETSPAIEIEEFVPAGKVDPVFFSGAYYLGPDKGGERPYALLAAALRKSGRCALARWAARGKQYLVLVRAGAGRGLVMQVLHHANEVRPFDEVPLDDAPVKDGELKLALQLVRKNATDAFRPEAYEDEVRKRYEAAIRRKVDGHKVLVEATGAGEAAPTVDIMQALKASLGGGRKRRGRAAA